MQSIDQTSRHDKLLPCLTPQVIPVAGPELHRWPVLSGDHPTINKASPWANDLLRAVIPVVDTANHISNHATCPDSS